MTESERVFFEHEMQRKLDAFCDEILSPLLDRIERLEGAVSLLAMAEADEPIPVATDLEVAKIELDLGLPPVGDR